MAHYEPPKSTYPNYNEANYPSENDGSCCGSTTVDEVQQQSLNNISKPQGEGAGFKITDSIIGEGYVSNGLRYTSGFVLGTTRSILKQPLVMGMAPNMVGDGDFPFIPSVPIACQMSSSDALDTGVLYVFLVFGYDSNYDIVSDQFTMTGQTPALGVGGQLFIRILGFQMISTDPANNVPGAVTAGTVYLTESGNANITAGVPDNASDIMASTVQSTGIGLPGYFTVPPGCNAYPSELLFSVGTSGKDDEIDIRIFAKSASQPWNCLGELWVQSIQPTAYIRNHAFTNVVLDLSGGTEATDVMFGASRTSGNLNENDVSAVCQMALIITRPA